mgnify:CR=1 FL=1
MRNLDEKIIDIFYSDIVPSVIKGRTVVDDTSYYINYNVVISGVSVSEINSDIPTLYIKNTEEFNKYLVKYIVKETEFLQENIFVGESNLHKNLDEQIRFSLMNLFIDATSNDFNNPVEYLKLRISFLENDSLSKEFSDYKSIYNFDDNDCHIESFVKAQHPSYETPYAFCSQIVSDDGKDKFDLPKIRYGIKDDGYKKEVYIYAIQGEKKKNVLNRFEKKINRYLFKINKGVVKDEEYLKYEKYLELGIDEIYPENVVDVTPKAVLALTVFLKVIKDMGIDKVTVVPYLPVRYDSKLKGKKAYLDLFKEIYFKNEMDKKYSKVNQEMEDNQFNITNKFIRTFNRVNYHLNNMSNIIYPFEIDDKMHFVINDEVSVTEHLINNTYNGINIDNRKRK